MFVDAKHGSTFKLAFLKEINHVKQSTSDLASSVSNLKIFDT